MSEQSRTEKLFYEAMGALHWLWIFLSPTMIGLALGAIIWFGC